MTRGRSIPRLVGMREEGDTCKTMEVGDDALKGTLFGMGVVVVVKVGARDAERGLHVVWTPDYGNLLRYVERREDTVTLSGTNPDYEPLTYKTSEVEIVGKAIAALNDGEIWLLVSTEGAGEQQSLEAIRLEVEAMDWPDVIGEGI
ncbi:MAG: S24 family peptidase [Pyrinomonadaceae bacterium]